MTVFITGGCKNGKSTFALQCALSLSERRPRYYVATMEPPCDADELERIRIHRAARAGKGFVTLEQGRNLPVCLEQADHSGVFLLDSVTALLANEMFPTNAQPDETATERIAADLGTFLGAVEHAVVVSDYLYGDGIAYDPVTERYRRGLAYPAETVLICEDIFCGIVPMEDLERKWRDLAGRTLTVLASKANTVTRIFCGLPQQLKP